MRCEICGSLLYDSAVDNLCYDCWRSTSYEDIEYFVGDSDEASDIFDENLQA